MPCRADWKNVTAINGSTLLEPAINAFLLPASMLINTVASLCPAISKEKLLQAEAWLACHLMAVSSVGQKDGVGVKDSEKFESYSVKWATSVGTGSGVLGTSYGQTANALTEGCLQEQDKRQGGIFFAGGA